MKDRQDSIVAQDAFVPLPRALTRLVCTALLCGAAIAPAFAQQLTPHLIRLADGRRFTLNLPASFAIDVAAQGLRRVRFFAVSPDHRIFATDMYGLEDNSLGRVYILDGWNERTHTFSRTIPYLDHLRNPNNVAFYTDPQTGQAWIYVPLTDRLVRYKYSPGNNAPTGPPEVLAHYPDYGLNYKYGGWHLTRTVAFATLHGHTKLFVSVGSSCNACAEKEPVRATVQVMAPDGTHHGTVAKGLRNAVGLAFFPALDGGSLFATNMGADHLGDDAPEETFFELDSNEHSGPIATAVNWNFTNWLETPIDGHPGALRAGNEYTPIVANYGWPTCYFEDGSPHPDQLISAPKPTDHIFPPPPAGPPPAQFDCSKVPAAYTTFPAHSSPLGLGYFDGDNTILKNSFLVALHGASHPKIGAGYRVVRFTPGDRQPEDFITGFLVTEAGKPAVKGRPCGLLHTGPDSFLLTDDLNGIVYSIHPKLRTTSQPSAADTLEP
jgi:glucose/arabinose dehydrogenase